MSGTGTLSDPPNISAAEISFGRWSTVDAEKRFFDANERSTARR
jgi:hypothetical protein